MSEDRTSPPAPASLPVNDDMLREILLRLPPLPSSLPRASLVCKRWCRLVSDPDFHSRFRAHHRTPPLLGYFYESYTEPGFMPLLDQPDRIPPERFSIMEHTYVTWIFFGCRHGLVAFLHLPRMEAVVWEPVTGSHCRFTCPPEVMLDKTLHILNGTVLGAASDYGDGYVHNHPRLGPFKPVVLLGNVEDNLFCVCVYESESRKWSDISSIAMPTNFYRSTNPGVLVRNALYWFYTRRDLDIVEFDLDTHSLTIIQKPGDAHFTEGLSYQLLRTEDKRLCFAAVSTLSIQLWRRNANSNGVLEWMLFKTVELDKLLPLRPYQTSIVGFDEDSSMIFLYTASCIFTIRLDSLQFKKILESVQDRPVSRFMRVHAYRSFYTAVGAGDVRAGIAASLLV